jgi:hypothetical protein
MSNNDKATRWNKREDGIKKNEDTEEMAANKRK